ncbi:hypothetical protein, partial [Micromonospora sp. NPDC048839]
EVYIVQEEVKAILIGFVALISAYLTVFSLWFCLVAIILGVIGYKQAKKIKERKNNYIFMGKILNSIGILSSILLFMYYVTGPI